MEECYFKGIIISFNIQAKQGDGVTRMASVIITIEEDQAEELAEITIIKEVTSTIITVKDYGNEKTIIIKEVKFTQGEANGPKTIEVKYSTTIVKNIPFINY